MCPRVARRWSASGWRTLNRAAAKWRLFELDERDDSVVEMDCTDRGNVATRLVHATNETAALERFAESIARVQTILPNCEVAVLSPAEIAFRWRGLEFARARMGAEAVTFRSKQEIVFGVGAEERVLEDRNLAVVRAVAYAHCGTPVIRMGRASIRLFRMHPERWLESLVVTDVGVIDERLETRVGVFAGSGVFGCRPRHDRRADADPRRTAGSGGAEGG